MHIDPLWEEISILSNKIDSIQKEVSDLKEIVMDRVLVFDSFNTLQKYQPQEQQPVRTPKQTIFSTPETQLPIANTTTDCETPSWTVLSPIFHDAALTPPNTLKTTEEVLAKYSNLQKETKLSELAVKLSRESFFGEKVMAESTVYGARCCKTLPSDKVQSLKLTLLQLCPQYLYQPHLFEPIWSHCCGSINHACARLCSKKYQNSILTVFNN